MKYVTTIGEHQFVIDINREGQVTVDGEVIDIDMRQLLDTTMYSIITNGQSHDVRLTELEEFYNVQVSGQIFDVQVEDERTRRLAGLRSLSGISAGEIIIRAPMPGVVIEVPVQPGQEVDAGDIVVILESMKMQNEFKAPRAGKVHTVRVAPGAKVDQNMVMVTLT
jgi:biotin carboxyl carrier protein